MDTVEDKSLKEKYAAFLNVRSEADKGDGLVSIALADAYLALTGQPIPSEYIGQPMRKLSGWSLDLFNISLERKKN